MKHASGHDWSHIAEQPLKSIATDAQSNMQYWKSIPHPLIQPLFLLFGNKPH